MSFRANSTVRNLFKIGRNLRRQNSYKNISINYSLKELFEKVDKSMDSKMSTLEKNLSSEIVVVNGEVKSVKYIIGSIVLVFFSTFVGAVGKYVIDNWLNKKTIEQPPPPLPNKDHEIIRKMRELLHEEKN